MRLKNFGPWISYWGKLDCELVFTVDHCGCALLGKKLKSSEVKVEAIISYVQLI